METLEQKLQSGLVSFRALWAIVGATALSLAILVNHFSGETEHLSSMSASYWTQAGSIFIGCLVAIGFCMFIYNGSGPLEFVLTKLAGLFATVVALFPTEHLISSGKYAEPPYWAVDLARLIFHQGEDYEIVSKMHSWAALLFFGFLTWIMLIYVKRAHEERSEHPFNYALFWISAFIMFTGLLILISAFSSAGTVLPTRVSAQDFFDISDPIYWGELVFLVGFGLGWLLEGLGHIIEAGYTYVRQKFAAGT